MMDMYSKNQYLQQLREDYLKTKSKEEKGRLLDEAARRTGLCRKHLIVKLRAKSNLDKLPTERKRRKQKYGNELRPALKRCWEIFDKPCGQRLKPLLTDEIDRLRKAGELICSDTVAAKLKVMSPKTIDIKLEHAKQTEREKQKYHYKIHPLLYQKVPVKVFGEQDREKPGFTQNDLVEHCGASASGEYIYTQSTTDIAHGWWEAEPQLGRAQQRTLEGIKKCRARSPIPWKEIHPDNDTTFLNWQLFRYAQQEGLGFSRSRSFKKNDNCLVEQKNGFNVRRHLGYLRFDTQKELNILRDLYRNELRLYKNFFQPQIKLISKVRIKGKIHRKYDQAKTPYQRVVKDPNISKGTKQELAQIYQSLNPAELKRAIDRKLDLLYQAYQSKNSSQKVARQKKISVRFLTTKPKPISVR